MNVVSQLIRSIRIFRTEPGTTKLRKIVCTLHWFALRWWSFVRKKTKLSLTSTSLAPLSIAFFAVRGMAWQIVWSRHWVIWRLILNADDDNEQKKLYYFWAIIQPCSHMVDNWPSNLILFIYLFIFQTFLAMRKRTQSDDDDIHIILFGNGSELSTLFES